MICDHVGGIRDPSKQDLAQEFRRKQNKVLSILTETHISHDQIHHKRNICWAPSFSLLEIATQKYCLSWFIWVLKVSLRLTLTQKRILCPLALLPLMTEFFKELQNYFENWNEGNENKIILGDFNCTIDKMNGKHKENKTQILYRYSFRFRSPLVHLLR